jgi:hypothetical protein
MNRIFLVSAALFSFFIPAIQSDWVQNLFITQKVQYTIYSSPALLFRIKPIADTHITVGAVLGIIYAAGIVFLVGRFAWQINVLNRLMADRQSTVPYSFFKNVELGDRGDGIRPMC